MKNVLKLDPKYDGNAYRHLELMCSPEFVDHFAKDFIHCHRPMQHAFVESEDQDDYELMTVRGRYIYDNLVQNEHSTVAIETYSIDDDNTHVIDDSKYGVIRSSSPMFKDRLYGSNIYNMIWADKPETVVFLAHHDVVRIAVDNCNDNTASVCHLLQLNSVLSKNVDKLKYNVLIAFVDHEETCNFQMCGSVRLAERITSSSLYGKCLTAINLELTARGRSFWINRYGELPTALHHLDIEKFKDVVTPFNDSVAMNARGVRSVCIGSWDAEDIKQYNKKQYCDLWATCHTQDDRFATWASKYDMRVFNKMLQNVVMS